MLENRGISLKSIELGSDFVMAYIAHKTTQPLRLGLTGAIFPLVKRLVKKWITNFFLEKSLSFSFLSLSLDLNISIFKFNVHYYLSIVFMSKFNIT